MADYGQPLVAYSDRGSNLVSAAREGGDTVPCYDWDRIAGSARGKTEWKFHPPGSQFRNGAVEVFVKKLKRSLSHKFASRMMFLLELGTAFKVVASILNSRPIYARWGPRGGNDPDYLSALTPNMLLTGRANTEVPVRDYDRSDKPLLRLQYVEECIAQWWNQFMAQNFSSLVPRQKWFYEQRNVRVGDVVLVQYEGKCRPATYRLAVVIEVEVDADGLVRTVSVEYSLLTELPFSERLEYKGITKKRLKVPVQRLVLVLPVEERNEDSFPGGMAGGVPAPLDEVDVNAHKEVNSGRYDVVWDAVGRKYVCCGDRVTVVEDLGGQHGLPGEGAAGVNQVGDQVLPEGVTGTRSVMKAELRSCFEVKRKIVCKDFEKTIYEVKSESFDWKDVDEVCELKKIYNDKTSM